VIPRLLPHGRRLGLISEEEYRAAMESEERVRRAEEALRGRTFTPNLATREVFRENFGFELETEASAFKLLQRNELSVAHVDLLDAALLSGLNREERSILETRVRYEGYILRERERLERLRPFESRPIPAGFRYSGLPGLSVEVVEQCSRRRPRTVGEAARIPGVTPAAIAIICAHVARAGGSPTA